MKSEDSMKLFYFCVCGKGVRKVIRGLRIVERRLRCLCLSCILWERKTKSMQKATKNASNSVEKWEWKSRKMRSDRTGLIRCGGGLESLRVPAWDLGNG